MMAAWCVLGTKPLFLLALLTFTAALQSICVTLCLAEEEIEVQR